jgi:hypothetical protein
VEIECHGDTQKGIGGRWNGKKLGLEEAPIIEEACYVV